MLPLNRQQKGRTPKPPAPRPPPPSPDPSKPSPNHYGSDHASSASDDHDDLNSPTQKPSLGNPSNSQVMPIRSQSSQLEASLVDSQKDDGGSVAESRAKKFKSIIEVADSQPVELEDWEKCGKWIDLDNEKVPETQLEEAQEGNRDEVSNEMEDQEMQDTEDLVGNVGPSKALGEDEETASEGNDKGTPESEDECEQEEEEEEDAGDDLSIRPTLFLEDGRPDRSSSWWQRRIDDLRDWMMKNRRAREQKVTKAEKELRAAQDLVDETKDANEAMKKEHKAGRDRIDAATKRARKNLLDAQAELAEQRRLRDAYFAEDGLGSLDAELAMDE